MIIIQVGMIIKVVEFVFSHCTRIWEHKCRVLFKELPMTLKSREKMTMRKNYFCRYMRPLK